MNKMYFLISIKRITIAYVDARHFYFNFTQKRRYGNIKKSKDKGKTRKMGLSYFYIRNIGRHTYPIIGNNNELVVECARKFYQIVKFVKTAIHYHRYLLKKHGYDNEFNFQSLKFSTVVLFMVKFIQQIYLFQLGRIQELTTSHLFDICHPHIPLETSILNHLPCFKGMFHQEKKNLHKCGKEEKQNFYRISKKRS